MMLLKKMLKLISILSQVSNPLIYSPTETLEDLKDSHLLNSMMKKH